MGMVRIRKALVLAGLAALLGGLIPAPATAGGGCVSRPEYRRVEVGMRKARVHRIFDTRGEVLDEGSWGEERAYDICPEFKGVCVFVTYDKDNKVVSKEWILGE
jgi:hypothetical protein